MDMQSATDVRLRCLSICNAGFQLVDGKVEIELALSIIDPLVRPGALTRLERSRADFAVRGDRNDMSRGA
jgi:hypothetical protein